MKRSSHTMLLTGLPPARLALADRARVAGSRQAGPASRMRLDGDLFLLMRSPQDAATADRATPPTPLDRPATGHGVLPPRHAPGRSH